MTPLYPHRSRSVVRIYTTVKFEPSKINIFVKDCQRGGKDVTCMSAIVCFNITGRTAVPPTQEIGKPVKIIHCSGSNTVKCPCSSTCLCPVFGHPHKVNKVLFHLLAMQNLLFNAHSIKSMDKRRKEKKVFSLNVEDSIIFSF